MVEVELVLVDVPGVETYRVSVYECNVDCTERYHIVQGQCLRTGPRSFTFWPGPVAGGRVSMKFTAKDHAELLCVMRERFSDAAGQLRKAFDTILKRFANGDGKG